MPRPPVSRRRTSSSAKAPPASVAGTLTLSASNVINSQLIQVGAANNSGDASGVLHLGLSNSISAGEFDIGMNNANGSVTLVNGGSVTLGSAAGREHSCKWGTIRFKPTAATAHH